MLRDVAVSSRRIGHTLATTCVQRARPLPAAAGILLNVIVAERPCVTCRMSHPIVRSDWPWPRDSLTSAQPHDPGFPGVPLLRTHRTEQEATLIHQDGLGMREGSLIPRGRRWVVLGCR